MTAQMTFRPAETPLRDLLEEIHKGTLQLPDFQRDWVWDDDRIRDLLASLSQAWPVGAVLLLECGGEVAFKARAVQGAPENPGLEKRLILDGQQRLTSLYSTLRAPGPVQTIDSKGTPIKRVYFFDIAACMDEAVDRKEAVRSLGEERQVREDFNRTVKLDLSTPELEYKHLCIPITTAFDPAKCRAWRREMGRFHKHDQDVENLWDRFEQEIVETIQQYRLPSIELGRNTSRQAVCMVFEKVNTGGKPLDVFELVTATYAARNVDMRDDWAARGKRLAAEGVLSQLEPTDFLQAVTLLSTFVRGAHDRRVHVGCRRVDILNLPLEQFRAHADAIEQGFLAAARMLERERIFDTEYLPYQNQLIPFAAILATLGDKAHSAGARRKLLEWYWCGVFGELYSGSTETRFGRDIIEVPAWIADDGDEPTTVRNCNFSPSRLATLATRNSAAYKGMMALLLQQGARDIFGGGEVERSMYVDEHVDLRTVFPDASFEGASPFAAKLQRSVLNKTPWTKRTWRRIGSVAPRVYLDRVERSGLDAERVDALLRSHCIDAYALRSDDLDGFFRGRARRFLDAIERLTGKPINGRESEETKRTFGSALPAAHTEAPRPSSEKLFGRYTVLETLPSGGMSEGYKVKGPEGEIAFLKKVPVDGIAADALRRELDVYARLHRHEAAGVLRVLGVERNDTHVALLTELADGGTLANYVRAKNGLPAAEAKSVALTVLAALRELHGLDVVHRDLKPENVLSVKGHWKLADFGIAKNTLRVMTQNRTFQGHGTPGFAPPEQVDGAEAHPSADVFAFGKLVAFVLSGQTDVDRIVMPSWAKLTRRCTQTDASSRPTLDEVETTLASIQV